MGDEEERLGTVFTVLYCLHGNGNKTGGCPFRGQMNLLIQTFAAWLLDFKYTQRRSFFA